MKTRRKSSKGIKFTKYKDIKIKPHKYIIVFVFLLIISIIGNFIVHDFLDNYEKPSCDSSFDFLDIYIENACPSNIGKILFKDSKGYYCYESYDCNYQGEECRSRKSYLKRIVE